jgi:antitoxin (DNA-binding transcriptional repressor) of toxin-antitoxin stability system
MAMKKAMISELKDGLSRYLSFVRRGEPVLVYDRDRLIARIEPVRPSPSSAPDWPADLERAGVLRAPAAVLPRGWLDERPKVRADVVAALLDERAAGR